MGERKKIEARREEMNKKKTITAWWMWRKRVEFFKNWNQTLDSFRMFFSSSLFKLADHNWIISFFLIQFFSSSIHCINMNQYILQVKKKKHFKSKRIVWNLFSIAEPHWSEKEREKYKHGRKAVKASCDPWKNERMNEQMATIPLLAERPWASIYTNAPCTN